MPSRRRPLATNLASVFAATRAFNRLAKLVCPFKSLERKDLAQGHFAVRLLGMPKNYESLVSDDGCRN